MYCVYGNSGLYIYGGPLFRGGPLLGGSVIGGFTVYTLKMKVTNSTQFTRVLACLFGGHTSRLYRLREECYLYSFCLGYQRVKPTQTMAVSIQDDLVHYIQSSGGASGGDGLEERLINISGEILHPSDSIGEICQPHGNSGVNHLAQHRARANPSACSTIATLFSYSQFTSWYCSI